MGRERQILKRRKSILNIRKIARTMEMVATARFKKFHDRTVSARPYTNQISRLTYRLRRSASENLKHPLLAAQFGAPGDAVVILASNRGLCGGYNHNVIRLGVERYHRLADRGRSVDLIVYGKKAIGYLAHRKTPMKVRRLQFETFPPWADVAALADELMRRFVAGELRTVHVAYMRFVSAGVQRPEVMTLLPLGQRVGPPAAWTARYGIQDEAAQYDFLPDPRQLLDELLPLTIRLRLYQCFLDAVTSEQVMRMTAMRLAGDNAEEMIRTLTLQYNRARQAGITTELAEIMSGSEALK